jgi:serine/threonine protein phosphatase 1
MYRILDKYILVHAGIDPFISMTNSMMISEFMVMQSYDALLWDRSEAFFRSPALSKYTVIFGHTPTHYITNIRNPMVIWNGMGKIGIDCGVCFRGGQLGCLRLDDMKEFYVLG